MPGTMSPVLQEPGLAPAPSEPQQLPPPPAPRPTLRAVHVLLLSAAAVFFALHYVHLKADFPNHSQWMDWAKYTDEGWYGDAAIRHYELGHWNVPGDFNPAAALPVWPLLELALFRFTGVSLAAARALSVTVFGLTLLGCLRLLRLWQPPERKGNFAPSLAVLLLAVSPFSFVFSRLAILEPLLVLLTVAALLAATRAGRLANTSRGDLRRPGPAAGWAAVLGGTLTLAVLTKTTAVFLFPAIAWTLWAACGMRLRPFVRCGAVAALCSGLLWGAYYGLFVRPHFLQDYKYLFSANTYTVFKWDTLGSLLADTLNDAIWVGRPVFILAVAGIVWAAVRVARGAWRREPLLLTLLLWIFGYGAFLTYHANLQPRYYLVVTVPLTALVALECEWAAQWLGHSSNARRVPWLVRAAALATVVFAAGYTVCRAAWHTADFLLHPEYTWLSAANQVAAIVNREAAAGHPRLVLSISGSDLSLMTGVPSICDDFGTLTVGQRVAQYRPGWFAAWNDVEDDKMEALAPLYRVERVAAIPAFDDPERNLLILYRLDPLASPGSQPQRVPHRRPAWVPRSLRTPAALTGPR